MKDINVGKFIRLFIKHPLNEGLVFSLNDKQSHYIYRVMRLRKGQLINIFNGYDGEWNAKLLTSQRTVQLQCQQKIRAQINSPDNWLIMALLKQSRLEIAVEKAVEIGVKRISLVATDYSNQHKINLKRMQKIAVEAAEQCGGMDLPEIEQMSSLKAVIKAMGIDRRVIFCDEELAAKVSPFPAYKGHSKHAIIIGPEGGFTPCERSLIESLTVSFRVSLGSRILRTETAAISALTLLNAQIQTIV